jgi:phosphoglycerate dehydrogenase-like enzyme
VKRVLVWTGGGDAALCEALRGIDGVVVAAATGRADALARMPEADALITSTVLWDTDFALQLQRSMRLTWVQVLNAGFDNMERLGVPARVVLSTIGDIGASIVAEHAIALLLALLRGLPTAWNEQRAREWRAGPVARSTRTMHGLHVGVIGFGHIGQAFAALALAFGTRVVAFAQSARRSASGVEVRAVESLRASLGELDALVICAPLTETTDGLIDADAFAAMKPGAYLVNVSRGAIVDTPALLAALDEGTLAGAALDVVEPEPLPRSHALWSSANVILTPHTAWAGGGRPQLERLRELLSENVRRFARGEPVLHAATVRRP